MTYVLLYHISSNNQWPDGLGPAGLVFCELHYKLAILFTQCLLSSWWNSFHAIYLRWKVIYILFTSRVQFASISSQNISAVTRYPYYYAKFKALFQKQHQIKYSTLNKTPITDFVDNSIIKFIGPLNSNYFPQLHLKK